jgi:tetratricopeptide (TPR) repeat protein
MNEAGLEKTGQYLDNEMSPDERREFELQIANDEELRNYIQLYSGIDKTMKAENTMPDEKELRQTLDQMGRKYFTGGGKVIQLSLKKLMAIAASVIILVSAGIYFFMQSKPSAEKLYAQFAQHETINIQARGSTGDSLAQQAAEKFNGKHYEEALLLFQQYLAKQPDDIQMKLSMAICYMELGKNKEADAVFSELASGSSAYAATAQWYQALSALKKKDMAACRTAINSIPSSSSFYAKAQELKGKLPD